MKKKRVCSYSRYYEPEGLQNKLINVSLYMERLWRHPFELPPWELEGTCPAECFAESWVHECVASSFGCTALFGWFETKHTVNEKTHLIQL